MVYAVELTVSLWMAYELRFDFLVEPQYQHERLESSATVNLIWGLGNALAGLALAQASTRTGNRRWDRSLISFEAGVATFAIWMATSEAALRVNTAGHAADAW